MGPPVGGPIVLRTVVNFTKEQMMSSIKLALAALIAAIAMSIAAGTASANRSLGITNGPIFTYSGNYTFTDEFGSFRIVCDVLRVMTLHRAPAKTRGALSGFADVITRNCTGAIVRVVGERWHLQYESFSGTLPEIRTVTQRIVPGAYKAS